MSALNSLQKIAKAFTESAIVPDVLRVSPPNLLNISYSNGATANLGNRLSPSQTKDKPLVSWRAEDGAHYTLIMIDPDAPSRRIHLLREVRHWLVMNIPGSSVENGDEVIGYRGVGAPRFTGLHRYIFFVYKQPNGFIDHTEIHTPNTSLSNRMRTSVVDLAQKYSLMGPEFGNFFFAKYE